MHKTALTIDEIIRSGPLGRTSIYQAIRRGQLTAHKWGKRTFVFATDYDEFLRGLPLIGAKDSVATVIRSDRKS
jgi:hypothetical protein